MLKLINLKSVTCLKNTKFIHTSCSRFLDQDWRMKHGLAKNPNAESSLTTLPDYTYMDGRPTPLGQRQMKRVLLQRKLTKNIIDGSLEIEHALKRHKELQAKKLNQEQAIIDNKLKPKGHLLLKKK